MKVQIRRIGPKGIELDGSFPADLVGLTQKDVLKFVSPFEIKVKVTSADDEILAKVAVRSRLESFCCRCLEAVKQDWAAEFTLTFDAKAYTEFIEIDEDIRQELILNLPVRILCREDCKGLCVECGINLNAQECPHRRAVTGQSNS